MVELEAQGLENFPEWREKLRVALEQVGWVEAEVKGLQVAFGDANVTQNRHEDELKLIFDKLSMFQEGFLHNIHTMTERVKKMESSTLAVFTAQGLSQMEALVYQILDMEKDRVSDRLRIDGFESRLNAGADKISIGEVIVRSPKYL